MHPFRSLRLLFVHRSLPGQFGPLIADLVQAGRHQIVFITAEGSTAEGSTGRGGVNPAGVHVVTYRTTAASERTHVNARPFDGAMRCAVAVAEVAAGLQSAGFTPDLIVGHEGWGETLNLRDVWPGVPQIGYREYFYHESGTDVGWDPEFPVQRAQLAGVRAKNAVGLLAMLQGHAGVTPTAWQRGLYPGWAQAAIHLVPDAVALGTCRPDPEARRQPFRLGTAVVMPGERLVTFVARDLEPYRGFHTFMRALPALLARPDTQVVCLGGDGASYGMLPLSGTWRSRLLAELGGRADRTRLHFPGRVPHADFVRLLQRSDVHAALSYPFVVSWSLREALACGCAVVAADTPPLREFVTDGHTGVLVPPLDADAVAGAVGALLDDGPRRARLGAGARAWAERHLVPADHRAAWGNVVAEISGLDLWG